MGTIISKPVPASTIGYASVISSHSGSGCCALPIGEVFERLDNVAGGIAAFAGGRPGGDPVNAILPPLNLPFVRGRLGEARRLGGCAFAL